MERLATNPERILSTLVQLWLDQNQQELISLSIGGKIEEKNTDITDSISASA